MAMVEIDTGKFSRNLNRMTANAIVAQARESGESVTQVFARFKRTSAIITLAAISENPTQTIGHLQYNQNMIEGVEQVLFGNKLYKNQI